MRTHKNRFFTVTIVSALFVGAGCAPDSATDLFTENQLRSKTQEAIAPLTAFLEDLEAADGAAGDQFGYSVAIEGDTAIVGAPMADVDVTGMPIVGAPMADIDVNGMLHADQGAAYVFVRNATRGQWELQQKLTSSDGFLVNMNPRAGDLFGSSVALSGETAVVGATHAWINPQTNNSPGAAYVFVRNAGVWTPQAKLLAPVPVDQMRFGASVSISGNTLLVGAPNDHDPGDFQNTRERGSAHVFNRTGSAWIHHDPSPIAPYSGRFYHFGTSVSLSRDIALIGATADFASVFRFVGGSWTLETTLVAGDNDNTYAEHFGSSVALSGNRALIGAPDTKLGTADTSRGAAYVFVNDQNVWTQEAKLVTNSGAPYDFFGSSVALRGDIAFVGAPQYNGVATTTENGRIHVYVRGSNGWSQEPTKTWPAPDGAINAFGKSVALSEDRALIGAFLHDNALNSDGGPNADQGKAYFFGAKRNGLSCASAAECASDLCIEGRCCDALCDGPCVACSVAKKGFGMDGTCEAVKIDTDPDEDCPTTPVSSCGTTGVCNGAGACQLFAAGSECAPATCSPGQATPASMCDGNGTCVAAMPVPCAPYACSMNQCLTSCTTNADCTASNTCVHGICDNDGDGIPLPQDNCPNNPNPNQTNTDGDGQGDLCDIDDDNDTIPDTADNCPLFANQNQEDQNHDGIGDACVCSNPTKPDGATCDDNNSCTVVDKCQNGVCVGTGSPCPEPAPCQKYICNPVADTCTSVALPDQTPCNGGTCVAGGCVPDHPSSSSSGTGGMSTSSGMGGSSGNTGGGGGNSSSAGGTGPLGGAGGSFEPRAPLILSGGGCDCNAVTRTNETRWAWVMSLLGLLALHRRRGSNRV